MKKITARPLNAKEFSMFGDVLEGKGDGAERWAYAAKMENQRPNARPNMTYMRMIPADAPVCVTNLERHVFSNQTFIPLNGTKHLIVVCRNDENGYPLLDSLIAFIAGGSQAVNYHAGIWHAPRTALCMPGEFVMFRWDEDTPDDTELIELETVIEVDISNQSCFNSEFKR